MMKTVRFSVSSASSFRRCAALAAAAVMVGSGESQAIFGLFEKDPSRKVPDSAQLAGQEGEASAMLAQAGQLEAGGQRGKAQGIYKKIVKNYPRTQSASDSQFKVAEIYQADGKQKRAFEAYQKFLTDYKGSSRFEEAVQRQFVIAEDMRVNRTKGFLGGIGASVQPSKLLEFYQLISANAPRTELAAQSYLAIGTVQAELGDLAQSINAFESVVENFPNTKYASEAQYQLFTLHGREANISFSPVDMRQQREAGEDFLTLHQSDPRSADVQAALGQLEDRASEKAFNVGRFYERSGNLKSAAIYYREVIKRPGTKHYEDAQKRMARLIERDPSLSSVAQQRERPLTSAPEAPAVALPTGPGLPQQPAQPQPPTRRKLFGPSSPNNATAEPQMRTSPDDVLPIPTDDPAAAP